MVTAGNAADIRAVLHAAIADPDPVIVMESLALYSERGEVPEDRPTEQVLGRADFVIHNEGDLDALTDQVDAAWAWMEGLD